MVNRKKEGKEERGRKDLSYPVAAGQVSGKNEGVSRKDR